MLRDRFIAGDPLRGLAVLSVFMVHVGQGVLQLDDTPVRATDAYGAVFGPLVTEFIVAPYFFFALSAYLLARPFVDGGARPSVRKYFRNRVLRIVPAFWVLVAVVYLRHGDLGSGALGVLAVPLFQQSLYWTPFADINLHAWTLDVEVLFYAALPLALLVRRARAPIFVAGAAILYVAGVKYHAAGPESDTVRKLYGVLLYAFGPGVVLAVLEPYVRPWLHGRRLLGDVLSWLCLIYAVLALALMIYGEPTLGKLYGLGSSATVAILTAALVRQWTRGDAWRLIDNRPCHWLGERSYGFYLWHLAIAIEVTRLAGDWHPGLPAFFVLGAITFVFTCLFADLSYRYVEMPFLRRRVPWRRAGTRRRAPAPAPLETAPQGAPAAP